MTLPHRVQQKHAFLVKKIKKKSKPQKQIPKKRVYLELLHKILGHSIVIQRRIKLTTLTTNSTSVEVSISKCLRKGFSIKKMFLIFFTTRTYVFLPVRIDLS